MREGVPSEVVRDYNDLEERRPTRGEEEGGEETGRGKVEDLSVERENERVMTISISCRVGINFLFFFFFFLFL